MRCGLRSGQLAHAELTNTEIIPVLPTSSVLIVIARSHCLQGVQVDAMYACVTAIMFVPFTDHC